MTSAHTVQADDGTTLAWHPAGSGARRVLFVHGWMVSSAVWDPLLARLDLCGLSTATMDLRGAGASSRPTAPLSLDRHGADLLTVVDALGWDRFTVVGHSMGGQLAQWLAVRAPERVEALCAICPVPQSGVTLPDDATALFSSAGGDARKLETVLTISTKSLTDADRQALLADALAVPADVVNQTVALWRAGFSADLANVRARTLVVASEDPALPAAFLRERVVARIAGARLAFIPGAGHYPQHERPAETAAVVEAFLAGGG